MALQHESLKEFVKQSIAPYASTKDDLHVDPFGDFTLKFFECKHGGATTKSYGLPFFGKDLHEFVKNINDVELNVNGEAFELPGVSYAIHRLMPMNSSSTLTMLWLNTKTPYIESVFVPWMQDNTLLDTFPLVKADMQVTFPKLSDNLKNSLKFWYYGVRPQEISLHRMTNEAMTDFYRKVTFTFDYFWIND